MKSNRFVNLIKKLKKTDNDSGVAMITAMIIGVVVMVFCLLLLMVTYILYSQSTNRVNEMQCKIIAQSGMEALRDEIRDSDSEIHKYLADQIEAGTWLSADAAVVNPGSEAVTELELDLVDRTDSNDLYLYDVKATLSYGLNQSDDDFVLPDIDDDNDGSSGANAGGNIGGNVGGQPAGIGNVTVHIKITVIKGPEDNPLCYITYEADYDEVSFN